MTKSPQTNKKAMFHELRNCLGPIQTFLQVVPLDSNPELKNFRKLCQENLVRLNELIKQLQEILSE